MKCDKCENKAKWENHDEKLCDECARKEVKRANKEKILPYKIYIEDLYCPIEVKDGNN